MKTKAKVNMKAMGTWLEPYIGMEFTITKESTTVVWFPMDLGFGQIKTERANKKMFDLPKKPKKIKKVNSTMPKKNIENEYKGYKIIFIIGRGNNCNVTTPSGQKIKLNGTNATPAGIKRWIDKATAPPSPVFYHDNPFFVAYEAYKKINKAKGKMMLPFLIWIHENYTLTKKQ